MKVLQNNTDTFLHIQWILSVAIRFSGIILMQVFVSAGDSLQSWRLLNPKAASFKGFLSSSRSACLHHDGHNDKNKNDDDDDDDNNYDERETQL